jgi:hypothetical protein
MDIKEFQSNQVEQSVKNHPWEMARFNIIKVLISKYLKINQCVGLDVGCGDLFFLNRFSKHYKGRYYAVDLAFNEEIMEKLIQKFKNDSITLTDSLEKINPEKKVNFVFLLDVIEHVEKTVDFLKTIKNQRYIDSNTLFFVTVPAYQSLYSNHDLWLGHIKRYNFKTLYNELNEAGLQIINSGSFFSSLLTLRFIEKIFEKKRNKNVGEMKGISGWNKGNIITQLYRYILIFDYYIFGHFFKKLGLKIPGLSMYAICKVSN